MDRTKDSSKNRGGGCFNRKQEYRKKWKELRFIRTPAQAWSILVQLREQASQPDGLFDEMDFDTACDWLTPVLLVR